MKKQWYLVTKEDGQQGEIFEDELMAEEYATQGYTVTAMNTGDPEVKYPFCWNCGMPVIPTGEGCNCNEHYFEMSLVDDDSENVMKVINQGIDSRLTGFTRSKFKTVRGFGLYNSKLFCWIHPDEMEILIRRLLELEIESAEMLADDIVYVQYGKEVI